jgi:IS30 family transposase
MSQENNNTQAVKREHLTVAERKVIERMLRSGANKGEISRALFRDKSTIKREIKRGSVVQKQHNPYMSRDPKKDFVYTSVYFADAGQRVYNARRANCGSRSKITDCAELVGFVEGKILGKESGRRMRQ